MSCERCRVLEEELRDLRLAFGFDDATQQVNAIQHHLGMTPKQAQLLFTLWGGKGRAMNRWALEECLNPEVDYRSPNAPVHICKINKRAGARLVENIWGRGWRLTPEGMQRVGEALKA